MDEQLGRRDRKNSGARRAGEAAAMLIDIECEKAKQAGYQPARSKQKKRGDP